MGGRPGLLGSYALHATDPSARPAALVVVMVDVASFVSMPCPFDSSLEWTTKGRGTEAEMGDRNSERLQRPQKAPKATRVVRVRRTNPLTLQPPNHTNWAHKRRRFSFPLHPSLLPPPPSPDPVTATDVDW